MAAEIEVSTKAELLAELEVRITMRAEKWYTEKNLTPSSLLTAEQKADLHEAFEQEKRSWMAEKSAELAKRSAPKVLGRDDS
jgi:hypothetical protein